MSLKISVTPPGIDPGTVRLIVQRLKHHATPDPTGEAGRATLMEALGTADILVGYVKGNMSI
jgi:hypothetical protein